MNTYLFMFRSNLYWKYIPGGKFAEEKGAQIYCFLRVQAFLTWFFFKFYQLNKLWREERNCVWPKLESRFMMLKKITGKGSSLTISLSQNLVSNMAIHHYWGWWIFCLMWCLNLTTTLLSSSCTAIQSPPNGHLKQEVDDDDNHVEDINNDHGL